MLIKQEQISHQIYLKFCKKKVQQLKLCSDYFKMWLKLLWLILLQKANFISTDKHLKKMDTIEIPLLAI